MTRQRRWQKNRQAAGACISCGKPRTNATYCDFHAEKQRERNRLYGKRQRGA